MTQLSCGLADRSNGVELLGWCFTKICIESVPTPDSETDRQRVHFPARQEGIPAHDAGATSVAPPPRSLTLSLVRGVRRISCTRGAAPPLSFFWFG